MIIDNFEIMIASVPDRERPVAEIYYNNMYWVEMSYEHEDEDVMVHFYNHRTKNCWDIPYEEAIKILEIAKEKLVD